MKLLVVDDHAILRHGLVALLQQFEQGAEVLQASETAEGLRLLEANPDLDVVFLDLNMPEQGGMDAIPVFVKRCPQLPVIVLSSSEDPNDVRLALKSGACGYVPKSASPKNILSALRLVLSGEIYVPPLMLDPGPAPIGEGRPRAARRRRKADRAANRGAAATMPGPHQQGDKPRARPLGKDHQVAHHRHLRRCSVGRELHASRGCGQTRGTGHKLRLTFA